MDAALCCTTETRRHGKSINVLNAIALSREVKPITYNGVYSMGRPILIRHALTAKWCNRGFRRNAAAICTRECMRI